ncbi:MAG TPA: hypothetical protein VF240_13905 [Pyrinomonadaceae bacterium]
MRNNGSTNKKSVTIFGVMFGAVAGVAGLVAAAAGVIRHRKAIKRLIEIERM